MEHHDARPPQTMGQPLGQTGGVGQTMDRARDGGGLVQWIFPMEGSMYKGLMDTAAAADSQTCPWMTLGASSPRLTQHGAWIQACVDALAPSEDLCFVSIGESGTERALAPLVATGHLGRVGFLGVEAFNEPMDVLAVDEEARDELCAELARRRLALRLARLPAHTGTVQALERAYRGRGVVVVRPCQGSPLVRLDESWCEAESHLNAKRRSDLRRARRRAEKIGPPSIEVHAPDEDALAPILEEVLAVELRSWKGAVGAAILQDEERGPMLRRFAVLAARAGILRLALLRIGTDAVAMQFGCVHGGAFWLLKVAYDQEFRRCSPGQLLAATTIGRAAAEGLERYEFLGVPEDWTELWTNDEQACVTLRTFPYRPRGMALLAGDACGTVVSRVRRSLGRSSQEGGE
jgi:CelD/BcsL family acetyltransferase involved in cellulose biosynthesis